MRDVISEIKLQNAIREAESASTLNTPPPIGIEPRIIWLERRRDALYETINTYRARLKAPSIVWLEELVQLEKEIQAANASR